jgi:hypothetical protein
VSDDEGSHDATRQLAAAATEESNEMVQSLAQRNRRLQTMTVLLVTINLVALLAVLGLVLIYINNVDATTGGGDAFERPASLKGDSRQTAPARTPSADDDAPSGTGRGGTAGGSATRSGGSDRPDETFASLPGMGGPAPQPARSETRAPAEEAPSDPIGKAIARAEKLEATGEPAAALKVLKELKSEMDRENGSRVFAYPDDRYPDIVRDIIRLENILKQRAERGEVRSFFDIPTE